MVSGARSRIALLALTAIFLIPVGMSSLRGLTHVLTCEEQVPTPFTLIVPPDGPAQILSSMVIEAEPEPEVGLCGGLVIDMRAGSTPDDRVEMTVLVSNQTEHPWHGTVQLRLDRLTIPIEIRRIEPGATERDSVSVRLREGAHEIEGYLLVGP